MASKYKFIIVAPDSRTADFTGWSVPTADEPPSADMLHAQVRMSYFSSSLLVSPVILAHGRDHVVTALGRSVPSAKKPPLPVLLQAGVMKGDGLFDRLANNRTHRTAGCHESKID